MTQVQNLLHIKSRRRPQQSFPGGASTAQASLCVLEGHGTIQGRVLSEWVPLHPLLPPPMLCCQKGPLHPQFGHQHSRGALLHPPPQGWLLICPTVRHFVLPMLLRARCGLCSTRIHSGILR